MSETKPKRKISRRVIVWVFVLLLIIAAMYFFTYYFAKKKDLVIYQDATRRIYLVEKKGYSRPDREMWRLVYEDMKTGARTYITGNAPKGYPAKKMAQIILNTIDQGKKSSYDSVQRVGVTTVPAKTDIHSNLVDKKSIADILPKDLETEFPKINI